MASTTDFIVNAGLRVSGTGTVTSSTGQTNVLQTLGGAAFAKNIIVGSTADVYGTATFYSSVNITGTTSLLDLTVSGVINSTNTTLASTTAGGTGALVTQGGVYLGNNLIVMSTASSTATGLANALYVNGGTYVNDQFTVAGPTLFKDTVLFSGTATYVYSTNTLYTDNILELHIPPGGADSQWNFDDGKDIGIRIRYYNGTDTNAALLFANDTKSFEFYKSGAEGTSTFSSGVYSGLKAGSLWLVDTTASNNTYSGALIVNGGAGIAGNVNVGNLVSAGILQGRNLTDTQVAVAGLNGSLYSYGSLSFNTSTGIVQGTITTATLAHSALTATLAINANSAYNIFGGSAGALVYQTATGATSFVNLGTATHVLTSNGVSPYWAPVGNAGNADSADNLTGGQTGQIPFQSAPNTTIFSSTLSFSTVTNTLEINGGSTASGHIAVSGNISSSSTVSTKYLRVNDSENSQGTSTGAMTVVGGAGIGRNLYVGGEITVGSVTTNTVVSILTGNNLNLSSYTKTGITGSGMINLDYYNGSAIRSSKYFVQITDGPDIHVTEISMFHDDVDAYKTEYGFHSNNGVLGSFDAIYTASNVILTFQPLGATDMTIKVIRWSITV
jgi:hypothetical protein